MILRSRTRPQNRAQGALALINAATALLSGAQMAAAYWPSLQTLLHTTALGWEHWGLIAALTLPLLIVPEAIKYWRVVRVNG